MGCALYHHLSRVGKLDRPPSCEGHPDAPCHLYWLGERELYVGWARQVTVSGRCSLLTLVQHVLLLMTAGWEVHSGDSAVTRVTVDSGKKCIIYHDGH